MKDHNLPVKIADIVNKSPITGMSILRLHISSPEIRQSPKADKIDLNLQKQNKFSFEFRYLSRYFYCVFLFFDQKIERQFYTVCGPLSSLSWADQGNIRTQVCPLCPTCYNASRFAPHLRRKTPDLFFVLKSRKTGWYHQQ